MDTSSKLGTESLSFAMGIPLDQIRESRRDKISDDSRSGIREDRSRWPKSTDASGSSRRIDAPKTYANGFDHTSNRRGERGPTVKPVSMTWDQLFGMGYKETHEMKTLSEKIYSSLLDWTSPSDETSAIGPQFRDAIFNFPKFNHFGRYEAGKEGMAIPSSSSYEDREAFLKYLEEDSYREELDPWQTPSVILHIRLLNFDPLALAFSSVFQTKTDLGKKRWVECDVSNALLRIILLCIGVTARMSKKRSNYSLEVEHRTQPSFFKAIYNFHRSTQLNKNTGRHSSTSEGANNPVDYDVDRFLPNMDGEEGRIEAGINETLTDSQLFQKHRHLLELYSPEELASMVNILFVFSQIDDQIKAVSLESLKTRGVYAKDEFNWAKHAIPLAESEFLQHVMALFGTLKFLHSLGKGMEVMISVLHFARYRVLDQPEDEDDPSYRIEEKRDYIKAGRKTSVLGKEYFRAYVFYLLQRSAMGKISSNGSAQDFKRCPDVLGVPYTKGQARIEQWYADESRRFEDVNLIPFRRCAGLDLIVRSFKPSEKKTMKADPTLTLFKFEAVRTANLNVSSFEEPSFYTAAQRAEYDAEMASVSASDAMTKDEKNKKLDEIENLWRVGIETRKKEMIRRHSIIVNDPSGKTARGNSFADLITLLQRDLCDQLSDDNRIEALVKLYHEERRVVYSTYDQIAKVRNASFDGSEDDGNIFYGGRELHRIEVLIFQEQGKNSLWRKLGDSIHSHVENVRGLSLVGRFGEDSDSEGGPNEDGGDKVAETQDSDQEDADDDAMVVNARMAARALSIVSSPSCKYCGGKEPTFLCSRCTKDFFCDAQCQKMYHGENDASHCTDLVRNMKI